jgi:ABC-type branched-subunit amino acid transport system substrate-binding protein
MSWLALCLMSVVGLAGCASSSNTSNTPTGPIKVGVMASLSGPSGAYGPPIANAAKLAVDRINAAGGLLGQQLQLEMGDDAGDVKTGTVTAERLISKEKASVLVSMEGSNIRDAIVPIVNRTGALYIYAPLYEGGACAPNMFLLGEVPAAYKPLFPYVNQSMGGGNWYFVGNDYVWPQKTNAQAKTFVQDNGAQVVGQDLVPFGTNEFAEIFNKIKSSKAKHILLTLVGSDATSFVKEWRSFGLNSSTDVITLALVDNQLPDLGPAADGIYSVFGYFNGLQSSQNQSFLQAYSAEFGPAAPPQTTLSEAVYDSIYVWKLAAEKAGSVDPKKVGAAMGGITFADAPRGSLTVDPKTHHVSQHVYLVKAGKDDIYHLVQDFGLINPGPQCSF